MYLFALTEIQWAIGASLPTIIATIALIKLKRRAEDSIEDTKYNLGEIAQDLGEAGFDWSSEFIRLMLAGKTPEAIKVVHTAAKAMKTEAGRMDHFGPIAVKNMNKLLLHESYGSQILDEILKAMPEILKKPEAGPRIQEAVEEFNLLQERRLKKEQAALEAKTSETTAD